MSYMGEEIRAAKAIYEYVHGDNDGALVSDWMNFGNEVKSYFNRKSIQETAEHLEIKLQRIGG